MFHWTPMWPQATSTLVAIATSLVAVVLRASHRTNTMLVMDNSKSRVQTKASNRTSQVTNRTIRATITTAKTNIRTDLVVVATGSQEDSQVATTTTRTGLVVAIGRLV